MSKHDGKAIEVGYSVYPIEGTRNKQWVLLIDSVNNGD